MTIRGVFSTVFVGLCLFGVGCVATDSTVKTDTASQAAAGSAVAAQNAADAQTVPASKAPAVEGQPLSVEEIQRRRDLERELVRDHAAYLELVSQKNVKDALEYVAPEIRPDVQRDLWRFVGEYSFDNYEVVQKDIDYWTTSTEADIKAVLVVYQKNVVAPSKKEFVTKWKLYGDRWLIRP